MSNLRLYHVLVQIGIIRVSNTIEVMRTGPDIRCAPIGYYTLPWNGPCQGGGGQDRKRQVEVDLKTELQLKANTRAAAVSDQLGIENFKMATASCWRTEATWVREHPSRCAYSQSWRTAPAREQELKRRVIESPNQTGVIMDDCRRRDNDRVMIVYKTLDNDRKSQGITGSPLSLVPNDDRQTSFMYDMYLYQ